MSNQQTRLNTEFVNLIAERNKLDKVKFLYCNAVEDAELTFV